MADYGSAAGAPLLDVVKTALEAAMTRHRRQLPRGSDCYGSCRSLPWHLVGVGVPSLVGLAGAVLVAASPQCPGVTVLLVAAGFGDDGAAELSAAAQAR